MKIYLLNRTDDIGYDEYDSKIVVAETARRARKLANEHVGNEGTVWQNTEIVTCRQVSTTEEGEVLASFNAG